MYLLLKKCRCRNQRERQNTIEEMMIQLDLNKVMTKHKALVVKKLPLPALIEMKPLLQEVTQLFALIAMKPLLKLEVNQAVLKLVLFGPFRPHQAFMCFPSPHIPWEG